LRVNLAAAVFACSTPAPIAAASTRDEPDDPAAVLTSPSVAVAFFQDARDRSG
jgi:hypothetical protein